ncbi:MAG TPA: hypothetical protein VN643_16605 [Pyrinomonadaceae bacterium]|nr:hypothetical protein [Pyrinomonadaceae bacterium]
MTLILVASLLLSSIAGFNPRSTPIPLPENEVIIKYDKTKDLTTVSLLPLQISGKKDNYYSLHLTASFAYPGQTFKVPDSFRFELTTVVKGRKLNPDLYVVFIIDGKQTHLSSNRWAVKNPLPGRSAISEVMVMNMPAEMFLKFVTARDIAIKMGGTRFPLTWIHQQTLRTLADKSQI